MNAKNEISEELKELSEVVAGISRITPYTAPETAWFEGFPALVLNQVNGSRAREASFTLPAVLQGLKKEPGTGVPDGYFDNLASRMLDRIRAGEGITGTQDANSELADLSPLLARIGKKTPFRTPEGYFSDLSCIAPVLAGSQQKQSYRIPEGYFGQFPDSMLARVRSTEQTPARVITMGKNRNWLKYTAMSIAASFLLVVGWLSLHTSAPAIATPGLNPDIAKSLSNVSDQEIQNYLDNQNTPLADELSNSTAALDVDVSDSDVNSMLGDVSDAELKEYLEDHGDAKALPTN